jgi:hypothetical protein
MRCRRVLRAAQVALALWFSAAPVTAATYLGGDLVAGSTFLPGTSVPVSTGLVAPGVFSDTYQFNYAPPYGLAAVVTTDNIGVSTPIAIVFAIADFRMQWVLEGPGGGVLFDTGIGNGETSTLLPLPTPNGAGPTYVFDLIISGNAIGAQGGLYTFVLFTDVTEALVPVPGALPLFGTLMLVGLGLAARRRRRSVRAR